MTNVSKIVACLLLIFLISCNDTSEEVHVSTVDSNTIIPDDTTIIDLDNPHIDSLYSIALDSTGPTINPEDTNYSERR